MKEVINLRERLKDKPFTLMVLETLVQCALFDPLKRLREMALKQINERYRGIVKAGFVGDCQIMIELRYKNTSKFGYVCDAPKEYLGEPIPHPFIIDYSY